MNMKLVYQTSLQDFVEKNRLNNLYLENKLVPFKVVKLKTFKLSFKIGIL